MRDESLWGDRKGRRNKTGMVEHKLKCRHLQRETPEKANSLAQKPSKNCEFEIPGDFGVGMRYGVETGALAENIHKKQ
jgi:hypothetical protein